MSHVEAETKRSALHLLDSNDTYTAHGGFDPDQTMRVFSEAIEQYDSTVSVLADVDPAAVVPRRRMRHG